MCCREVLLTKFKDGSDVGNTTPNIGIYIPAAGETNYDSSFASGMVNVDQHDHTGAPTKGVQIATTGLADGSVTYPKLNANVADTATGIGVDGANPNKLQILGLLKELYQLGALTDGQLYVGKTGFPAIKTALTAGTGISVVFNAGAGSLTISNTGTTKVIYKVFITPGVNTYTPAADTPGLIYCSVEVVGGGGGSGGAVGHGAGGGGGGGGYARGIFTAATIGASQTVTIGDGGAAAASGGDGGDGGTTTFGALLSATGGTKGFAGSAPSSGGQGGTGGVGSLGSLQVTGSDGDEGFCIVGQNQSFPGSGGASQLGGSVGTYIVAAGTSVGYPGYQYGGGASGGGSQAGNEAGSKGAPGVCIITAYCT